MEGNFGVFDRTELLAEFWDDEEADLHRRELLELNMPEHMRSSPYDDLDVFQIPEDYPRWEHLMNRLRASRNQDRTVVRCLRLLRSAQEERARERSRAAA